MSTAYEQLEQLLDDCDSCSPSKLNQLLTELKQSKKNLVTVQNDQNQLVQLHQLLQDKLNKYETGQDYRLNPFMSSPQLLNSSVDPSYSRKETIVHRNRSPRDRFENVSNDSSFCLQDIGHSLRQLQEQLNVDMAKLKNQLTSCASNQEKKEDFRLEKDDKNLFLRPNHRFDSFSFCQPTQLQMEMDRRKCLENKLRQLQTKKTKFGEDFPSDSYASHVNMTKLSSFGQSMLSADDEPDEREEESLPGTENSSRNRLQTDEFVLNEFDRNKLQRSSKDFDILAARFNEIQKLQTRVKQIEQMIKNFESQHSNDGPKLTRDKNRNDIDHDSRTKYFEDFEPCKYFKRSDQNINRISVKNSGLAGSIMHAELDTNLLKEHVVTFFQTRFNSSLNTLQNQSVSTNPILATQQLINSILNQNGQLLHHQQSLLVWFQELQWKLILSSKEEMQPADPILFPTCSSRSNGDEDLLEQFLPWESTPFVFRNAFQTSSNHQKRTLNNQIEPGTRANNFWDNFKSQSRQNQLTNFPKNCEGQSSVQINRPKLNSMCETVGENMNVAEIISSPSLSSSSSGNRFQKMNTAKKLPNSRANKSSNMSANDSFEKQPKVNQIYLLYEMLEKLIDEKHDRKPSKSSTMKLHGKTNSPKTFAERDKCKMSTVCGEEINNFNDLKNESSVDAIHSSMTSTRSFTQSLHNGANGVNGLNVSNVVNCAVPSLSAVSNSILNSSTNCMGCSKSVQMTALSKSCGSARKKFRNKKQIDDLSSNSISELIDNKLVSNETVRPLMAADGQSSEVVAVSTTSGLSSTNPTMISSNTSSASNAVSSATNGTHHFLTRPPITGASRSYAKRTAEDSSGSDVDDDAEEEDGDDEDEISDSSVLMAIAEQPAEELKRVSVSFGDNSTVCEKSALVEHRLGLDFESGIGTSVVSTGSEVRLSGDGEQGL